MAGERAQVDTETEREEIDRSELPEEYLPEWEVCIRAYGPDEEPAEAKYDHLHPKAADKDEAEQKAVKRAKRITGIIDRQDAYEVVGITGPYDVPDVPKSVLRAARTDDDQAKLTEVSP